MQRIWTLLVAAAAAAIATTALAQDVPAVQGASEAEKAHILGLIEGAKKEGSVTYWDVVIQPETNDALTAAFLKYYGLPSSFKVNYQLLATGTLVTRVEQEIAADRVTVDIAAVGSPPWVFERANKGDALEYDSPQYRFYEQAIANGLGKKGFFAFNGAYLFVPMWDAGRTKFTGKSWNDVIGAVPAGRITVGDVSKSVAYLATYAGQKTILPQEYFKKLAAMNRRSWCAPSRLPVGWCRVRISCRSPACRRAPISTIRRAPSSNSSCPRRVWCCCRRTCSS